MNKQQTLKNAEIIGPEALKFTTWYFDQIENHGLVKFNIITSESFRNFINGGDPDPLKDIEDIEELCKELNAINDAPNLPVSKGWL